MGSLSKFSYIDNILSRTQFYVETGTGFGTSLSYASSYKNIKKLWSCEIDSFQAFSLNKSLISSLGADQTRISIYNMNSFDFLSIMFKHFIQEHNATIFLDAHYPSADLGTKKFDEETNEEIRLPLMVELDLYFKYRQPYLNDYLIIDDVLLYDETREYQAGAKKHINPEILPRQQKERNCLNNIVSSLQRTHFVKVFTDQEGYLIATPKKHEKIWD